MSSRYLYQKPPVPDFILDRGRDDTSSKFGPAENPRDGNGERFPKPPLIGCPIPWVGRRCVPTAGALTERPARCGPDCQLSEGTATPSDERSLKDRFSRSKPDPGGATMQGRGYDGSGIQESQAIGGRKASRSATLQKWL